ncbi:MAG: ATP-binding protein [Candidatus Njordarchaeia archaeon]
MRFIDREKEISLLNTFFNGKDVLATIYGRRRIGKTRLVLEFLKMLPSSSYVYFVAGRRPILRNLKRFSEELSAKLKVTIPIFDNLVDLFRLLVKVVQDRFLVVIDEFTYLIERDEGILSDMQEIVDLLLGSNKIKIIILGSLVGMMETRVLGYGSPIYGRSNPVIKLDPLDFKYLMNWFASNDRVSLFEIYATTSGVPKYLEFFKGEDVVGEIKRNFFDSSAFLFRDAMELLKEELRDPTNYLIVLEAIAKGMNKLSEISNYTYIEPTKLTSYINTLRNLGIVKREIPIFAPKKAKRGIYLISDFYFAFWNRFVSPHYEEIESGLIDVVIQDFEKNFNTYLGEAFEQYTRKIFPRIMRKQGYYLSKVGKWWRKGVDIDIVGLDDNKKEVVLAEVKWKKITRKDAIRIISKLEEKADDLPISKEYKRTYCIIAKEFERRDFEDAIVIDINQIG